MFRTAKFVFVVLWIIAIGFGLHALMTYKGTAGKSGNPPKIWPQNDLIASPSQRPLFVMFAHPRCPCTRASIGELELLAAQAKGRFDAAVLFYEPAGENEDWSKTASIDAARAIPGVRVVLDRNGHVAKQFAAQTSGQTVLYDANGKLLFSGGITGSRGHMGENEGFDSVLKLVSNEPGIAPVKTTKVFGCGLLDQCMSPQTVRKN